MPAEHKKSSLRQVLEGKSTQELEELLALNFSQQEDKQPDVSYIMEIMEVIREREENTDKPRADIDAAWNDFQQYRQEREQETSDAGTNEEHSHDHSCSNNTSQPPLKRPNVLRYLLIAAILVVVLCGTASAHREIFQALADWTTETFQFLTGSQVEEVTEDPFADLRLEVAFRTDTPVLPNWAPDGTAPSGQFEVVERTDRVRVVGAFSTKAGEFTIRVTIYNTLPDEYSSAYQKDDTAEEVYVSGEISHYIVGNNDNISAMWTNNCAEVYIQGALTVDEMQKMIDSIYEE